MPVIENAAHAKKLLAQKLMNQSGHTIVSTEISAFNNPDVLGVTRSDMLVEYEIKLSRADLMGELNSIKECKNLLMTRTYNQPLQGEQQMQLGDRTVTAHFRGNLFEPEGLYKNIGKKSKLDKHERYLIPKPSTVNGYGWYEHDYRPNMFYFAVTSDLVPIAMEICEGIPYGVIDLNEIYGSSSVKMKAGWMHREEVSKEQLHYMARSLSFGYWWSDNAGIDLAHINHKEED